MNIFPHAVQFLRRPSTQLDQPANHSLHIWNINSFDQWGVELGKKMANELLDQQATKSGFDSSTELLFKHIADNS